VLRNGKQWHKHWEQDRTKINKTHNTEN
jgi:hypothetical protein